MPSISKPLQAKPSSTLGGCACPCPFMYDMHPAVKRGDADAGGKPEEAPDEQQRPLGRRAVAELVTLLPPGRPRLPRRRGGRRAAVDVVMSPPAREPAVQVPQQLAHAVPSRGRWRVRVGGGRQRGGAGAQRLEVAVRHGARAGQERELSAIASKLGSPARWPAVDLGDLWRAISSAVGRWRGGQRGRCVGGR